MSQAGRDWSSHSVEGLFLRFVVHENRRCHGLALYDWLLREAQRLGIPGGGAFRGIAGYGRHGVLTEERFFELSGELPVEVRFVCSEDQAGRLLDAVEAAELSLFYLMSPVRYGVTGVEKAEWSKVLPTVF